MALQADAMATMAPQRLVYDGKLGELYGIFFLNLLLGIITLGIYRFWGRTRYRRYLWSHTSYDGDRFEYTGTGGELFRGFLIAFGVLIAFVAIIGAAQWMLGPERAALVLVIALPIYAILFVLAFAARYTALRYRLTRTQWRGIRGGLSGSAINFALRSIGYGILSSVTLYQFIPFATVRLWRYRIQNVFFGTAQARFEGRGRDLYWRFLGSFLIWIGVGVVVIVIAVVGSGLAAMAGDTGAGEPRPIPIGAFSVVHWAIVGLIISWWVFGLIVFMWYQAFVFRYITKGAEIAGLRFGSNVTGGRLLRLIIGNLLLLFVTFGIGYPIVLQRLWRFGAENILIHGQVDGAVIEQSRLQPPRLGEGWLEVLDPGII
jgi:uncharacterized membrane protein YjgN (DUF898 family)